MGSDLSGRKPLCYSGTGMNGGKLRGFWVVSGPLGALEFGHYKSYSGHGVRRDALPWSLDI